MQIWQSGRIPDAVARDLDGTDLRRLPVYPNMYLAPQAAFGIAALAGIPLTFLIPVLSAARQGITQ